jgi:hypothetical protein
MAFHSIKNKVNFGYEIKENEFISQIFYPKFKKKFREIKKTKKSYRFSKFISQTFEITFLRVLICSKRLIIIMM